MILHSPKKLDKGKSLKPTRAIIVIVMELLTITAIVVIAKNMNSIPYNVRELFNGKPAAVSVPFFGLLLNLLFGFPVWLAHFYQRSSAKKHLLFPFIIMGSGIVAWVLLRMGVPPESLNDIIGTSVLSWRWEFESIYRFMFLFSAPLVVFSFSSMVILHSNYFPPHRIDVASLGSLLTIGAMLLFLSHMVVVVYAATDNLTELMAGGGGPIASGMLFLWLLTLGFFGSAVSCAIARGKMACGRTLLILSISILSGYAFLQFGLENQVEKYGQMFSALQFLLSPNRESLVTGGDIFFRYCVVHAILFLILGIIQFPFWHLIKR